MKKENKKKSIYLDIELHRQLKSDAVDRFITLQELLEEIVLEHIKKQI